ncbi:hypothetical protein [Paramicrobacterium agarici]|uniref:hypothetical protein n=1 Tax=Paramicrobacterium agarici TaxID=630514 RepID=UPI001154C9F6|nr:hypothetical protein [Microbacterium agarici]TQO21627.1 hypothetical protein FB385_0436 [Microbacterium agarici]
MTTIAHLRKTALGLPEVTEGTHFGMTAFFVRGRGFVSVASPDIVQVRLSPDEVGHVLEAHSGSEAIEKNGGAIGIRVPLTLVTGKDLNDLVVRSWMWRAPKRLAQRLIEAQQTGSDAGDLPRSLGAPATRALLTAGLSTLDEVAETSPSEVAKLHGVGPRAMRLLTEALAEGEREWHDPR